MSFIRHKKIYQSDGLRRELNWSFSSLADHRSDESSTGYSFMSCSPAEPMSASPASNSFSPNPAAVQSSAVNPNCLYFSLSQPKGPLQSQFRSFHLSRGTLPGSFRVAPEAVGGPHQPEYCPTNREWSLSGGSAEISVQAERPGHYLVLVGLKSNGTAHLSGPVRKKGRAAAQEWHEVWPILIRVLHLRFQ